MEAANLAIKEIINTIGISNCSAHTQLGICLMLVKFVPKLLLCEEKKSQHEVVQEMLECAIGNHDFLKIIITDDELPKTQFSHGSFISKARGSSINCIMIAFPSFLCLIYYFLTSITKFPQKVHFKC